MKSDIAAEQGENQSVWTSFRQTRLSRERLREDAHRARISVSELCRLLVEGHPPPKAAVPTINVQTYNELGRIGININQQTHLCHQAGGIVPAHLQPLARILVELKAVLDQVRLEVIGADRASEENQ